MDRLECPEGVLLADKPRGATSHDIVRLVRRALGGVRAGHAGTLDPFATGLLLILVGRATRLAEYASALEKTYLAAMRLGAASSTGDPDGEITEFSPAAEPASREAVAAALKGFVGEQEQVPPIFSAKRVGGERAYRMARRSTPFTLAARRVRIDRIELLAYCYPFLRLRVTTGPGTYVRSLARDLGEALGSAAYLTELRRESIGRFSVDEAVDVAGRSDEDLKRRLLPPEAAVAHLPGVTLDPPAAQALTVGQRVEIADSLLATPQRDALRLLCPGGFLGIGAREGSGLRAIKVLYPERAQR